MRVFFAFMFAHLLTACSPAYRLNRELRTDTAYSDHMIGVAVYDPIRHKALIQHNADKPFTPASTAKLVSFYAGLLSLPDTLPALRYIVRDDSLIFWGTGNPLLLHPTLSDTTTLAFLRHRPERLFFSAANYDGPRFGAGWSWDDYNDNYSVELAPLPIYGNVVRFEKNRITPRRFVDSSRVLIGEKRAVGVRRAELTNQFVYAANAVRGPYQDVPFRWSATIAAQLIADTLNRPVAVINRSMPQTAQLLRGGLTDSLYKRMLHVSDNQFAEQIMFMIAAERGLPNLEPVKELRRMTDSILHYPATTTKWVDGSGLSRYNLFTPNTLINLLDRLYKRVPQARLFTLLPAINQAATLTEQPYVFAKSGSMSGVYNLAGYVRSKHKKWLYFCIMHNNFTQPVGEMRRRTVQLLQRIRKL